MNRMTSSLLLLLLISFQSAFSQTFSSKGGEITDFSNILSADTFKIAVANIQPKIDTSFGLSKACFTIVHPKVSDLKIELFSPDGTEIWLSNRNGKDDGANYFNTCFRSNGFSGYIHEGDAPFNGEYIPDGRIEYINNGQNPNGEWTLIVRDLAQGNVGALNSWSLEFGPNPTPNFLQSPCSESNGKLCQCSGTSDNCELLPDLVIFGKFTENQIEEYSYNHYRYPGQLRLAATIGNIGDGPMYTFGKNEWYCGDKVVEQSQKCEDGTYARQKLYQRIYEKYGEKLRFKDVVSGTNYYDNKPGHDHFHVDDWAVFRLTKVKTNRKGRIKKKVVAQGEKVSYCLFDTGICQSSDSLCLSNSVVWSSQNLPNYGLGTFVDCKSDIQGISVGGYDTYGQLYEGQYVQLPKRLRNGNYILEIEVDPQGIYLEKDETNNTFSMPISLSKQKR